MEHHRGHSDLSAIRQFDHFLAQLMDTQFIVPGTRFRFGIDPLLGLIPGVGDALCGVISLYFVARAIYEKMHWLSVLVMILNVLVEMLLGIIPLFGDFFDFWFKANKRNNKKLQQHLNKKHQSL